MCLLKAHWLCAYQKHTDTKPNKSSPPPPFLFLYTYQKCTDDLAPLTIPNLHFEKLNEMNYNDWHYVMVAMLIEKDLWDIIDGTETQPAGSANLKAIHAFVKKQ